MAKADKSGLNIQWYVIAKTNNGGVVWRASGKDGDLKQARLYAGKLGGAPSSDLFAEKIAEKLKLGFRQKASWNGNAWVDKKGREIAEFSKYVLSKGHIFAKHDPAIGILKMASNTNKVDLEIYPLRDSFGDECGFRIDHSESQYVQEQSASSLPYWQTVYTTLEAARDAMEAVRFRRTAKGDYAVLTHQFSPRRKTVKPFLNLTVTESKLAELYPLNKFSQLLASA